MQALPTAALAAEYTAARAAAAREWRRLAAAVPPADRVALIADTVWARVYPIGYRHTYSTLARRVADAARSTAATLDNATDPTGGARRALTQLADIARHARNGAPPTHAPPANQPAAHAALRAAAGRSGTEPGWQAVVRAVSARALQAGALHGILHAATDLYTTLRETTGHRDLAASLGDGDVVDWVAATLATENRHVAEPWARGGGPAPAPVTARACFTTAARNDTGPARPVVTLATNSRSSRTATRSAR